MDVGRMDTQNAIDPGHGIASVVHRNEMLGPVPARANLEHVLLSERSQTEDRHTGPDSMYTKRSGQANPFNIISPLW